MNCQHCDYLLFHLTRPICPECGRPFDIAEYRFEPGTVSFSCPHCAEEHCGNDERGLPSPQQFECLKCGRSIVLQDMQVVPKHPNVRGVLGDFSPWDRRNRHGIVKAWWETFKLILLHPSAFFRRHAGQSMMEAWLFAVIALYVRLMPAILLHIVFLLLTGDPTARLPRNFFLVSNIWFSLPNVAIAQLIYPLVKPFILGGIWACSIQVTLFLIAAERRSLGCTLRTVMYGLAPLVFSGVFGMLGYVVGWVWTYFAVRAGIRQVHGLAGWQASLAVLSPVFLLTAFYFSALFITTWL